MEVIKMFLRLATPVLLLCVLPLIHHVQAQGPEKVRAQMQASQARNSALQGMFQRGATKDMWMVVVCEGLQSMAPQCRNVQRVQQYFTNLPSGNAARRKRSWPYWNNNWNNNWNTNWNTGWNSGWNSDRHNDPWRNTPTTNSNPTALVCPAFTNQSAIYNLSPSSADYPAEAIGNAIVDSPQELQGCLRRGLVLDGSPPTVFVEPSLSTANVTCPFDQLRLWSYTSLTAGSQCYIIQNFQENVLYRVCNARFCQNCANPTTGYVNNLNQRLCITEYMTVSVWAFCAGLPAGTQIIRDRLIIPFACTCQSVRCQAATAG